MTMFSMFVEVEPSPLAETTVIREEDVAGWLKDKFELYKNVPGEIIFRASKLVEGVDPDWGEQEANEHYGDAQMGVEDDPNFAPYEFTGFDDIPEPSSLEQEYLDDLADEKARYDRNELES